MEQINRPAGMALSNEFEGDDAADELFLVILTKSKRKIINHTIIHIHMQSLSVSFTNHFLFLSYIRNRKKEKNEAKKEILKEKIYARENG